MKLVKIEVKDKNRDEYFRCDWVSNSFSLKSVNKMVNRYLSRGCTSVIVYDDIWEHSQIVYSVDVI